MAMVPFVKLRAGNTPECIELDAIEVKPRKFLIFVDAKAIDIEQLAKAEIPGWEDIDALFIAVHLRQGETVHDKMRLVEQFEDGDKKNLTGPY